jgi:hypothetical protein
MSNSQSDAGLTQRIAPNSQSATNFCRRFMPNLQSATELSPRVVPDGGFAAGCIGKSRNDCLSLSKTLFRIVWV